MYLYKRERSPYWWFAFTIDGKTRQGSTKRPHNDKPGAMKS